MHSFQEENLQFIFMFKENILNNIKDNMFAIVFFVQKENILSFSFKRKFIFM